MTTDQFYGGVCAHEDLSFHASDTPGAVIIKHHPTHACWEVFPARIKDEPWELMERIFCGRTPWIALAHMARVTGYYALVENFNRSKVGENLDRRKGNYSILEAVNDY